MQLRSPANQASGGMNIPNNMVAAVSRPPCMLCPGSSHIRKKITKAPTPAKKQARGVFE
jgi:hypothetical protein